MNEIEKFGFTELQPLLKEVSGPVDSFRMQEQIKADAKKQAVETGNLERVSFQACPSLDNIDQKKIRQESVRAWGIWQNFNSDIDVLTPQQRGLHAYASRIIWQATLVEASRRTRLIEQGESRDDLQFYRGMIAHSIDELYPKPDMIITAECLNLFIPKIESLIKSDDEKLKALAADFLSEYGFISEIPSHYPEMLDSQKAEALQEILKNKYVATFEKLKQEFSEINNQILSQVTSRFLELVGLAEVKEDGSLVGWGVKETTERNGFFTRPEDRVIECGKRTKEITWPVFERLIVHEVGVHATRAENGYRAGSELLALGIGDYEDAEEGVAILFEKIWAGTATKADLVDRDDYRYLVAAYAAGAIDGRPHDKNATFQFITKLNLLSLVANAHKKGIALDVEQTTIEAREAMFEHVYRAFRGMPEGIVMTKDMLYKEGKVKLVHYINESKLSVQELYDFLTSGKFDPTNSEHLAIREAILDAKIAT